MESINETSIENRWTHGEHVLVRVYEKQAFVGKDNVKEIGTIETEIQQKRESRAKSEVMAHPWCQCFDLKLPAKIQREAWSEPKSQPIQQLSEVQQTSEGADNLEWREL
eukprot:4201423-Ditylum_brightwellii.AAC.1